MGWFNTASLQFSSLLIRSCLLHCCFLSLLWGTLVSGNLCFNSEGKPQVIFLLQSKLSTLIIISLSVDSEVPQPLAQSCTKAEILQQPGPSASGSAAGSLRSKAEQARLIPFVTSTGKPWCVVWCQPCAVAGAVYVTHWFPFLSCTCGKPAVFSWRSHCVLVSEL